MSRLLMSHSLPPQDEDEGITRRGTDENLSRANTVCLHVAVSCFSSVSFRWRGKRGRLWSTTTEAELLDKIQTKVLREFSSLLFTVTSTALPWDFYFFKRTQPLTVSVKKKGGKPDRRPYPLTYELRSLFRNLKFEIENSQDFCPETSMKLYVHGFGFLKTSGLVFL
jgi:hypothetical protein